MNFAAEHCPVVSQPLPVIHPLSLYPPDTPSVAFPSRALCRHRPVVFVIVTFWTSVFFFIIFFCRRRLLICSAVHSVAHFPLPAASLPFLFTLSVCAAGKSSLRRKLFLHIAERAHCLTLAPHPPSYLCLPRRDSLNISICCHCCCCCCSRILFIYKHFVIADIDDEFASSNRYPHSIQLNSTHHLHHHIIFLLLSLLLFCC